MLWHAGSAEEEAPNLEALLAGFRSLGYDDGRTIALDHRFPNEEPAKFERMAIELVETKPDILLAANVSSALALQKATSTIPIVFIVVPDPVGSKLVDSLARPTGNLTGLSNFALEVTRKRIELLRAAVPSLSRVGLLINPNVPSSRRYIDESEDAATQLGLAVRPFEARSLDDIDRALAAMAAARMQAVSINPEGMFFQYRDSLGRSLSANRIPACVFSRETLVGGALMSYGVDHRDLFRRAAALTDRLLKGARPSELPVELPKRIEFVVNNRVARQLGITMPQSLLVRADEVIE
ncbi:MAG TPA: ABC transporter substrate-binding protein [Burkholderiaceae bacterium]|nr:ABC transporter substrate-binding protein [Burkholderiaceae bacterium]